MGNDATLGASATGSPLAAGRGGGGADEVVGVDAKGAGADAPGTPATPASVLRHCMNPARAVPATSRARPTPPIATSLARFAPLLAAPAAMPMPLSMRCRTSFGDGTGGGAGVR